MITHVLIGKARPNLSPPEEAELAAALSDIARVPGVLDMTWGPGFDHRAQGFTHAAVVHFADRKTLEHYLSDPEHKRILDVLNQVMPDRLIISYETATSGISV